MPRFTFWASPMNSSARRRAPPNYYTARAQRPSALSRIQILDLHYQLQSWGRLRKPEAGSRCQTLVRGLNRSTTSGAVGMTSDPGGIMESKAERNVSAITYIVGIPLGIALLIWTIWITATAFIGGQAPFFFIEFTGFSLLRGLFWLIIVDPLVLTLAYWIFMLIMMPIGAAAAGLGALGDRRNK